LEINCYRDFLLNIGFALGFKSLLLWI